MQLEFYDSELSISGAGDSSRSILLETPKKKAMEGLEDKENSESFTSASKSPGIKGASTVPPSPPLTLYILPQPTSARSLFGTSAFFSLQIQPDSKSKASTLIKVLQAIIDNEKKAQSNFVDCATELMRLDAGLLQSILDMARKQLVLYGKNQSTLTIFLEEMGTATNTTIDHLQGIALNSKDNEDEDMTGTKQTVNCLVFAISVLEKLLFPKKGLLYCQGITVKGFSSEEKQALGTFLEKIDPSFSTQLWVKRWEMEQIPCSQSLQFFKNPTVRLDTKVKNLPQGMKCCCVC